MNVQSYRPLGGLLLAGLLLGTVLTGCSDSVDSDSNGTVRVEAEMDGSASVSRTLNRDEARSLLGAGATVDSLHLSRVRILISALKLHRSGEDTTSGDRSVHTGPILVTVDSAGTKVVATETIPAGTYDKIKFEFHKLSANEVSTYLNDPFFSDFVTDDRYTFIFDGTVYKDGSAFPFTYRSDATANLDYKLDPAPVLNGGSTMVIVLRVDPRVLAKDGNGVLDPRDGSNEPKFDNAIKSAIHALRR